ncbi:hypothetical protein HETIRDRAFT_320071, partial [Heterobasidion irregulare TC 32-1]
EHIAKVSAQFILHLFVCPNTPLSLSATSILPCDWTTSLYIPFIRNNSELPSPLPFFTFFSDPRPAFPLLRAPWATVYLSEHLSLPSRLSMITLIPIMPSVL